MSGGAIQEVNAQGFDQVVSTSTVPVVVDFWAPWCGPCQLLGPVVDTLATENAGKIKVGKLNVDENQNLTMKFGVRGVPTLIFLKQGQEVKRIVGAQAKTQLQQVIDALSD